MIHEFSLGLFKDDFSTALVLYHQKVGLFGLVIFKNVDCPKPIHILIDAFFHWESGKISD